ncbi:MAG: IPT/TIG domain-containing protein [Candidatus Acidiferrales bacterium]
MPRKRQRWYGQSSDANLNDAARRECRGLHLFEEHSRSGAAGALEGCHSFYRRRAHYWIVLAAAMLAAVMAPRAAAQVAEPSEIVLPSRMVATEPATLAVLDRFGRLVPRIAVTFSDGSHTETDVAGRAFFPAPSQPGAVVARIATKPEIAAAAVVLPYSPSAKLHVASVPALASVQDRFEIRGDGFRGDAGGNQVKFREDPALVLASSPACLVLLLNPSSTYGTGQLTVSVDGQETSATLTAVSVEFDVGDQTIAPGIKAKLTVRVRGTDQAQFLDVQNLAPNVLRFMHGDEEHTRTRGGVDNSTIMDVQGVRAGDFSFRVRVLPATFGVADVEAAHALLAAAQKEAPAPWAHKLDPLLARLERPNTETPQLIKHLDKMMEEAPGGDFVVLLRAARQALYGR